MLRTFIEIETITLIIGVLLAIGYRIMVGETENPGLLSDSVGASQLSIGRIQLLVFMLIQAGTYVGQMVASPHRFPSVPIALLAAYGGSNVVYVGAKFCQFVVAFLDGG